MPMNALFFVKKSFQGILLAACCCLCVGMSAPAYAESVYENQPPMNDADMVSFIKLLPQFRAWAASQKDASHPSTVDGKADFTYSDAAAEWVKMHNLEPKRFFFVMGKAAAALYLVSEGLGPHSPKPKDMPSVSQGDINLVQKHLPKLLEAGSDTPPL